MAKGYKSKCDYCGKTTVRQSVGPTGRKTWMVRVDKCSYGGCGSIYPSPDQTLTNEQMDWVTRYNRTARRHYDKHQELTDQG